MATTDPAVEAAERQMEKQFGRPWSEPSYQLRVRTEAAREALAPARKWYESNWSLKEPDFDALARLIYTSEEIQ